MKFQSTLPRRERPYEYDPKSIDAGFQSTLPRRERPPPLLPGPPTRKFQSTLPRRERRDYAGQFEGSCCFNPRSHEGSDPDVGEAINTTLKVSIHAPTKGATVPKQICILVPGFQSTLPRRERQDWVEYLRGQCMEFQSTLPRRERRRSKERAGGHHGFNPRSHEGSDQNMFDSSTTESQFQSTLPRRERPGGHGLYCIRNPVSIHAPTKGATAISAKNSFQFSAKINKLSFYILNFPLFPSPLFSTFHFICAYFRVRIPRHFYVCFLFALLYYHKINVSSTAIPRSTPICSTFV